MLAKVHVATGDGVNPAKRYWRKMRRLLPFASLLLLLGLGGSAAEDNPGFLGSKTVSLSARRVDVRAVAHAPELKPVGGWVLSSHDRDFGGVSALALTNEGFIAVSDTGALMRFSRGLRSVRIESFPRTCVPHLLKHDRDSESMARDPATGQLWIGFEWRNTICRIDPDGGSAAYAPKAMEEWPKAGGPEAMLKRSDGRFLVFAERAADYAREVPLLIYDRDPTSPAAKAISMRYRPPDGYRPTDAAMLPDGRMLVVNRRFALPFSFSAIVTLVEPFESRRGLIVGGRPVIRLMRPGIADNFEGIAVSSRDGRTFVWLVSDDNFLPYQATYLLEFELVPNANNKKAASRGP